MKSKILKILGVVLTLSLVLSLGAVFTAAPVLADEDEWSTYDLPDAGEDGDYFWDNTIAAGPGPIARDIDGYFWAYVDIGGTDEIVKSLDTEGRSWEVTDYSADAIAGAVVGIACSPEDEDVVYVAIGDVIGATDAVWKTKDGGDTWKEVSDISAATGFGGNITCLTVGYADDEPWVYAGTTNTGAGDVFVINDVAFGGTWTQLDLDDDVFGIAASPDFDNDALVAALSTDGANITNLSTNEGADVGTWTEVGLENEAGNPYAITGGSDPVFPEDFDMDDAYEIFVGVAGATHGAANTGGVYRIYGDTDDEEELLDDVDEDIISLDLAGNLGDTYLMAGTTAADVWYSDDDGDSWLQASDEGIQPAGAGDTYVICDEDIADDGMGWAATAGLGAGVHLTLTGGESWVGISLMATDAAALVDIGPSPEWVSDEVMFVIYTNTAPPGDTEMLRYDGTNWERVWEENQYAAGIDMVDCSPDFGSDDTVFAGLSDAGGGPNVYFSEDSGTVWEETRNAPTTMYSWAIIDADTIIAGGTDSIAYVTDRQGRRAWDDNDVTALAGRTITSLAVWGDTVICGTDANEVFISEDLAETWDQVGDDLDAAVAGNTYVGFDTDFNKNNTIYAASDNVVSRFLDVGELDEDWEDFTLDGAPTTISGLAVADGCVYVSDAVSADGTVADPVGAVQRTVNPLEDVDDVDDTEFDFMAEGLDADDGGQEIFDLLYVSEGSTFLWAVDTANATIWTIEDLLAVPASGGEADPDVDSATLIWDGFDNATDYEVRVYSNAGMGLAYEWFDALTGDDDPILRLTDRNTTGVHASDDLDAGTEYWWRVRASEPVNSKWSEIWTFTTLPATMTIDADQFGPAIGATGVPIMPSFGWQDIEEADSYKFELADNPDFTTPIVSTTTTNPVYKLDTPLKYNTNYFWRVKAISGTGQSRWATGTFTTMAEPVEAPAPPPAAEAPTITIPTPAEIAPKWIYAIIGIGATLTTVVIVLIFRTRKL